MQNVIALKIEVRKKTSSNSVAIYDSMRFFTIIEISLVHSGN